MILIQYQFSSINTEAKHNQPNRICIILTPLNCHQNPSTTKTTCDFKYHSSNCIRYYNEPNLHTYTLTPNPTRVQIYKYSIKTCSYLKLNLYLVQNIKCVSIQSIINHIEIVHFKPIDPDLSLDLVLHQLVRSLLSLHHNPYLAYWISYSIRYSSISPYPLCLMIFFSFYSLRSCSIPWSKTITNQYHAPNTRDQHI